MQDLGDMDGREGGGGTTATAAMTDGDVALKCQHCDATFSDDLPGGKLADPQPAAVKLHNHLVLAHPEADRLMKPAG